MRYEGSIAVRLDGRNGLSWGDQKRMDIPVSPFARSPQLRFIQSTFGSHERTSGDLLLSSSISLASQSG